MRLGPLYNDGVSPQAATVIDMVPVLERKTLLNIERLLMADLADPSPAEVRQARLGLLIEMVSVGTGELPRTEDYDALREQRRALGQQWPDSSTLGRVYSGSWPMAVRAAMRLAFDDDKRPLPNVARHDRPAVAQYTREEALDALRRFADEHHGRWPTGAQYASWSQDLRRQAQQRGNPLPRVPSISVVRKKFGRFAVAVEAARLSPGLFHVDRGCPHRLLQPPTPASRASRRSGSMSPLVRETSRPGS